MYETPHNDDPDARESWREYLSEPASARALSKAMPHGRLRILEAQAHQVDPGVLAPVLTDLFTS